MKKLKNLDKVYEPKQVEPQWWKAWEVAELFHPSDKGECFSVVIPPPNVTGYLHIGHALNNTLQDIVCRYQRMLGKSVLWVFGMDHAGIATQNVVERRLAKQGQSRQVLGREAFIKKVWEWKETSGGVIRQQLKRLGASLDYQNERFTMDEGLSEAVKEVFVRLYKDGLIYRAKRLVNWDCKLKTAISDLEVENRESTTSLWHIRYPLAKNPAEGIVVATTRPETLLGDTAVAVHPKDLRYEKLVGQEVLLPLTDRKIPIIADEYSDPLKGSGAVKITPAHDFNDFEVGERHGLEALNILDEEGFLLKGSPVPRAYQGLERFKAREQMLKDLEEQGFLIKTEEQKNAVPYGDRSGTIIEPRLTDQWFVDAKKLAPASIKAVEEGQTKFVPQNWEKTYFEWMHNIQPWCISRQLWWGHQIPAWHSEEGKIFVARSEEEALGQAKAHYGKEVTLTRDPDVLDTWFSSALWPFSTLGWPKKTQRLQKYYPTQVLTTSFDIIFFWVARMMMMGLYFTKEVPFREVYIHALIRDAQGQKMSKSKGNVMDPLEIMDKHGTDAFRFSLAAFAAQGRDIKLSEERIVGYRNFCNKIWNASRFVLSTAREWVEEGAFLKALEDLNNFQVKHPFNQWILTKLSQCTTQVREGIEKYKFNESALSAYHFFWGTYCDWYLELIKEPLRSGDLDIQKECALTAWIVLDQFLRLVHPIMPFMSEELWHALADREEKFLLQEKFPESLSPTQITAYAQSAKEVEALQSVLEKIRQIRMETGVSLKEKFSRVSLYSNNQDLLKNLQNLAAWTYAWVGIEKLNLNDPQLKGEKGVAKGVCAFEDLTVLVDLKGLVDLAKEKARQQKELNKIQKGLESTEKTLANEAFVKNAPKELIEEKRKKLDFYQNKLREIEEALEVLGD